MKLYKRDLINYLSGYGIEVYSRNEIALYYPVFTNIPKETIIIIIDIINKILKNKIEYNLKGRYFRQIIKVDFGRNLSSKDNYYDIMAVKDDE